jgi:hypothetical protein
MEDWRGRGPVELGCSRLEPQVSKKTLLRTPAGRGRTRTTESACAPRATHRSRVEIPSSRQEQAGQDASSPIRLFSPSHAVSPHLPSATQLHTNFAPPRHDRHETATLQLSPCLAHALPMPNLRGGQVTSELAAGVGPCDALQHIRESMVVCCLTRSLAFVALWHRRDCPAQMQHPSAVFTLRGALPSD